MSNEEAAKRAMQRVMRGAVADANRAAALEAAWIKHHAAGGSLYDFLKEHGTGRLTPDEPAR